MVIDTIAAMSNEISRLLAGLADTDPSKRAAAASELSQLGPQARVAAIPLLGAIANADDEVSEWVATALEELGPPAASDLKALTVMLVDSTGDTAYWAATLIGRLEASAAPAVDALVGTLDAANETSVRQRAAWALGKIGPAAAAARGSLQQAAAGDDPRLARMAQRALDGLGDDLP